MFWIVFLVLVHHASAQSNRNVGKFWHVTDFHYDQTYSDGQLSCHDPVASPGLYGHFLCDSPWILVTSAISFMKKEHPDVDFLIWTGDTVAHIKDPKTSWEMNREVTMNVTEALAAAFQSTPVYASLGNHDFYPANQAEPSRSEAYEQVAELWKSWIAKNSQIERFEDGGFYAVTLNRTKIRVLALNTNLYYTSNKLTASLEDPAGQFAWMESQLMNAKEENLKVIITAHIPPAPLTKGIVDWFYPAHKKKFVQILLDNSDVIVATHYGHDHQDGFKIVQNSDGSKAVSQFTAPSVTPWIYKLFLSFGVVSGPRHNPGIRVIEYDRDTGAHIDYTQYYLDLDKANAQRRPEWKLLYRFTSAYDLTDMSIASLRKLFGKIKGGKNKAYTTKYCKYANVMPETTDKMVISDVMRAEVYCVGLHYDANEAKECVTKATTTRPTGAASSVRGSTLITLIFCFLIIIMLHLH